MGAGCSASKMDDVKAQALAAKDKHDGKAPTPSPKPGAEGPPMNSAKAIRSAGPAVSVDTQAGIFLRRDAPQLPANRYPDGFTIRVTSARAMHDPKDKPKSIQLFEVCVFDRNAGVFDAAHAANKRWKTLSEFEHLHSAINGLEGVTGLSLPSSISGRKDRSKILMEDRRKALEAYTGTIIKLWNSANNIQFNTVVAKWLNFHINLSYVAHLNMVSGVDQNTAEFIDPADAKNDLDDGMLGAMPKMSMPSLSMPKLSMPSLSMPSFSMPNMSSFHLPSLPSLPSLGDTPADIAKRAADAAACLAERQENQLAYLDALGDAKRAHHVMARALAWIQQNGNGWTWKDEESGTIDHWAFDRSLQTATRTINTKGTIKDSENKTTYYWDEPIFVSGDIFELPLTKKQSKPGVLNWNMADDDDIRIIRIKIGTANNRVIDMEFHGEGGAEFCQGKDKKDTRKQYYDSVPPGPQKSCEQHNHPLTLFQTRYQGTYVCNICRGNGTGPAYACAACGFDVHPKCLA